MICVGSSMATPFAPGRHRHGSAPGNGPSAAKGHRGLLAVSTLAAISMVLMIVWHNADLRSDLADAVKAERFCAAARARRTRRATAGPAPARRTEALRQCRVAVANSDWPMPPVDLEKALTTIGSDNRLSSIKEPALALLKRVENELQVDADRCVASPPSVVRRLA